jgi:hypothetical protein
VLFPPLRSTRQKSFSKASTSIVHHLGPSLDSEMLGRPIEACIVILPILELALRNNAFPSVLVEGIKDPASDENSQPPLPHTILSLSSYLLTHATSTSSSRAIGYANVALHILLACVESDEIIRAFCELSPQPVRLCRQVCLVACSSISRLKTL